MRVAIVGLGAVGEACAHALVVSDIVRRLVLINRTLDFAEAVARDLRQARAWGRRLETDVQPFDAPGVLQGCDLVLLTLGSRLRGDQDRRELARATLELYKRSGLLERLAEVRDRGTTAVLVVTNPVEISVTWLRSELGMDPKRIFGLGTTVESARLSHHLASRLDVDAASSWVHVLGEHGQGIVPVGHGRLSGIAAQAKLDHGIRSARERTLEDARIVRGLSETIGASKAEDLCARLLQEHPDVPGPAVDWLRRELASRLAPPATRFAIAAAVVEVARAILSDSDRVMTLSALPPHNLELPPVALSLPFAVRRGGLGRCLLASAPSELVQVARELHGVLEMATS